MMEKLLLLLCAASAVAGQLCRPGRWPRRSPFDGHSRLKLWLELLLCRGMQPLIRQTHNWAVCLRTVTSNSHFTAKRRQTLPTVHLKCVFSSKDVGVGNKVRISIKTALGDEAVRIRRRHSRNRLFEAFGLLLVMKQTVVFERFNADIIRKRVKLIAACCFSTSGTTARGSSSEPRWPTPWGATSAGSASSKSPLVFSRINPRWVKTGSSVSCRRFELEKLPDSSEVWLLFDVLLEHLRENLSFLLHNKKKVFV